MAKIDHRTRRIVVAALALWLAWAAVPAAVADSIAALQAKVAQLFQQGRYAEAIPLAQRALAVLEETLGLDHPRVAVALTWLAELYRAAGRYDEAEPLYRRALAIAEKVLGPDDPNLAAALNNMAVIYLEEGRYAEAEPLLKQALAIREKVLNPDHPDIAGTLQNLAGLYEAQGRYAEAETLFKQLLAIRERTLGPNHRDIAGTLHGLAVLYWEQGRYAEAEALYKRAIAIYVKALGPNSQYVADELDALGLVYASQGRYAEAEPLYKQTLLIYEKALGPDHPDVAKVLNNLALLYLDEGRSADAEPLYGRALAIAEKTRGPNHPDVANALISLAEIYTDEKRYADAAPLFLRSLAIYEKALGPDHPTVATALNNLSRLYHEQGRDAEAEPLLRRSLAIREKALSPDHPDIANALTNLATMYQQQGRYAEAEPLFKRALSSLDKSLGPDHPDVAEAVNHLAFLYEQQGRTADALPLVQRVMAKAHALPSVAIPVLLDAQRHKLVPADQALDDSLGVMQQAAHTAAASAVGNLAVRLAAGSDRLAERVRRDQDLTAEARSLDRAIIAAASNEPSKRDAAAERRMLERLATITREHNALQKTFAAEFPDYAALLNPQPLNAKDVQALLADDEALVVISAGGDNSYVWAITRDAADWNEVPLTMGDIAASVTALRDALTFHKVKPFDLQASFALYRKLLAPVENLIRDKPRLSFVLNDALTSLPPQVLVTRDPAGKEFRDVDWLVRTHAVTVLPSVASLKALRGKSAMADAAKPLIGFADPVFGRNSQQLQQNPRLAADVTAARGIRGTLADLAELKDALPPLPETAKEVREVAASVKAKVTDVFVGPDATETRVKREKLDQYRIVYFATHGLLAGDISGFAKLEAEPALVLSLPEKPTEFDDGLLSASEVAQLKLNADWVVLSACNTASGETPGAEALSGLARAFFYAGGRSLLVSNWEVESNSAVALMVETFRSLATEPKLSHGEALQTSMLAMIDNPQHPEWADPRYWAPFVVVGEPAKPAK